MPASGNSPARDEVFTVTRVVAAPRDLVWRSWTEPERLKRWWGPKGFTWVTCTLELRPGGLFHYCMRSPAGHVMWGKFVYRAVAAPERLEFIVSFSDEHGGTTRHPMSATWPLEVMNTVTLTEQHGKTTLTLQGWPHDASAEERKTFRDGHASMEAGFGGTLAQLEQYLAEEPG